MLQAKTGSASTQYLYSLGTRPLAEYEAAAWEYLLPDPLGSVRQIADPSGNVALLKSYEPYGSVLDSQGNATSVFAYAGEQVDAYIKLVFLRARYYSPDTARFLSKDMWQGDYTRPQTLNGWIYVEADPINRIDPSGRLSIHDMVVLRYAFDYYLWPEKILPFTVPPNTPSWARWGKHPDLLDFINFEIYEVEPDQGGYFPPGHGPGQVQDYLDLMNNANNGNGWIVNNWQPGNRVGREDFTVGLIDVHARLYAPGVIVYTSNLNQQKARELIIDICMASLLVALGQKLSERDNPPTGSSQPAPAPEFVPGYLYTDAGELVGPDPNWNPSLIPFLPYVDFTLPMPSLPPLPELIPLPVPW